MNFSPVRKITNYYLNNLDCCVIAYWGNLKPFPNLWHILDVYAQAKTEDDDPEEALLESFSEIIEDIQIQEINQPTNCLFTVNRQFSDCKHKLVFINGELLT